MQSCSCAGKISSDRELNPLAITRLKKKFLISIFFMFSDVIIGLPSDDNSIEINEDDHKEWL